MLLKSIRYELYKKQKLGKVYDNIRVINIIYYSIKIFPRFRLAKTTRLIHDNQLLMTKFGRILYLART